MKLSKKVSCFFLFLSFWLRFFYTFRVIMLLTDGVSTNSQAVIDEANKLRNLKVVMFSIGLGNNINHDELNAVATSVENHKFLLSELGNVGILGSVIKGGRLQNYWYHI